MDIHSAGYAALTRPTELLLLRTMRSDHAAKSEGVTLHQPRFAAHPHRGTGGEAFVAVFTRRAQDIKTYYANPKGGRLYARRVRFG